MGRQAPLITVITPSHNTPTELFDHAFDSMMAQQFDQEFIEWVVVVHNSTQEYLQHVQQLAAGHPSIRVFELNNDKRTASSPRNYALDQATGTYITFLDADDTLTPECLSTIVEGMQKTGAQVGKYRSEKLEEGGPIVDFLDNRVRFDQTRSLITLDRDDKDVHKLMTMANMMMNCQVVERSFLESHHIRFREDVRIYEDVVFNIECLRDATTIAVFPQLIGYVYYIRQGSTMQELKTPSPQEVVNTCSDIATQLRIGIDSGLNMRYLFFGHMKIVAEMIQAAESGAESTSQPFPREARERIRDLLGPYFDLIDPPEPDRKFLSQQEIDEMRAWTKEVIVGSSDEVPKDDAPNPEAVLNQILRNAENTELGERWNFEPIRSPAVFARQVPITTYDFYEPMLALMRRVGESGILSVDEMLGYAVTSGTMGVPHRIPLTKRSIEPQIRVLKQTLHCEGSVFLLAESIRGSAAYADRVYPDSIIGAVLQLTSDELVCNSHRLPAGTAKHGALTSPRELLFSTRPVDPRYLRLLFALADPDIGRIAAPFAWGLLDTFRYLEKHWKDLVDDIERGTISAGALLTTEDLARLDGLLAPNPERAAALRGIFCEGFNTPIVPRVWPHCTDVIAVGTGDQALYAAHLARYVGDLPLRNGYYVASEALIGIETTPAEYRFAYEDYYFELLPVDAGGTETGNPAIPASEATTESLYKVLVTTYAGLYRYELEDVVRVVRMEDGMPVFSFVARAREIMGAAGVHALPSHMLRVVTSLEQTFDVDIEDYCVALAEDAPALEVYLEPTAEYQKTISNSIRPLDVEKALVNLLPGYATARAEGTLDAVRIFILTPEAHLAWRDRTSRLHHSSADQVKPVHALENPAKRRFFSVFARQMA